MKSEGRIARGAVVEGFRIVYASRGGDEMLGQAVGPGQVAPGAGAGLAVLEGGARESLLTGVVRVEAECCQRQSGQPVGDAVVAHGACSGAGRKDGVSDVKCGAVERGAGIGDVGGSLIGECREGESSATWCRGSDAGAQARVAAATEIGKRIARRPRRSCQRAALPGQRRRIQQSVPRQATQSETQADAVVAVECLRPRMQVKLGNGNAWQVEVAPAAEAVAPAAEAVAPAADAAGSLAPPPPDPETPAEPPSADADEPPALDPPAEPA